MKKLMMIASVMAIALTMASCSSDDPKGLVKQLMDAQISGDVDAVFDLAKNYSVSSERFQKMDAEKLNKMKEDAKKNYELEKDKPDYVKSYEILDDECEIDEEKGKAKIKVKVTKNDDSTDTDIIRLKKDDSGKWILTMF